MCRKKVSEGSNYESEENRPITDYSIVALSIYLPNSNLVQENDIEIYYFTLNKTKWNLLR